MWEKKVKFFRGAVVFSRSLENLSIFESYVLFGLDTIF